MCPSAPQSPVTPSGGWRCLGVVQIVDYAALRRRLGRTHSERVGETLAEMIRAEERDVQIDVVLRDRIELHFQGSEADCRAIGQRIADRCTLMTDPAGRDLPVRLAVASAIAPNGFAEDLHLLEEAGPRSPKR